MAKIPLVLSLYSKTKKRKFFDGKKTIRNAKIIKRSHACKGYTNNYNVEI